MFYWYFILVLFRHKAVAEKAICKTLCYSLVSFVMKVHDILDFFDHN